MSRKYKGFTLIELAVVIIIIAILSVGIIKASHVINSAGLANARSITARSPVPSIEGLMSWYEASMAESFSGPDKMIDGAQIEAWYNINPSTINIDRDLHKATRTPDADTVFRLDGINGVPGIEFAGTGSSMLRSEDFLGRTDVFFEPISITIVFKPYSNNSRKLFDNYNAAGLPRWVEINSTYLHVFRGGGPNTSAGTADDIENGNNYILIANYEPGVDAKIFLNDVETEIVAVDAKWGGLRGLTIGGACIHYDGSTNSFHGIISEFIVFNKALKLEDRREIMRYLSLKYKIPVKNL